ncbi:hypothetical protein CLAFUW4_08285, partial [Fulvia fulva]
PDAILPAWLHAPTVNTHISTPSGRVLYTYLIDATFHFELRRMWSDGHGGEMRAWVVANAYPELDEHGNITTVAGTLTDITHLQWAERLQRQRTDEAVEARRQQENFIDMTCHEIRDVQKALLFRHANVAVSIKQRLSSHENPLSAVVHCADLVRSSLAGLSDTVEGFATESPDERSRLAKLCGSAQEANGIVFPCCAHQKRIVDDILTMSKLDSKLVTIAQRQYELTVC